MAGGGHEGLTPETIARVLNTLDKTIAAANKAGSGHHAWLMTKLRPAAERGWYNHLEINKRLFTIFLSTPPIYDYALGRKEGRIK